MSVKYKHEQRPSQEWTDQAYLQQMQGKIFARIRANGGMHRLLARGRCPRCSGHFEIDRPSEVGYVGGGVLGFDAAPPVDFDLDQDRQPPKPEFQREIIVCNGPAVDGTPPGMKGCGACFSLYVLVES